MDKIQNKTRSPHHRRLEGKSLSLKSNEDKELDYLPDGSHITPHKIFLMKNQDDNTVVRDADYVGSFPVLGEDQNARAEFVKKKLFELRDEGERSKPVLLVISLSGIKVCSHTGESVYMAHALKRISYATCDPEFRHFSFLAREPRAHSSTQFCHAFLTNTADQAEELNTIVGNAFKMAYTVQWEQQQLSVQHTEQQQPSNYEQWHGEDDAADEMSEPSTPPVSSTSDQQAPSQPSFNDLIEQQLVPQRARNREQKLQREQVLKQRLNRISTPNIEEQLKERKEKREREREIMEREIEVQRLQGKGRTTWAKHVAQKTKHRSLLTDLTDGAAGSKVNGTGLSPLTAAYLSQNGDQPNCTGQKYHSIIELREALDSGSLRSYGSPVMTLKETIDNHYIASDNKAISSRANSNGGYNRGSVGEGNKPQEVQPESFYDKEQQSATLYTNTSGADLMNTTSHMLDRPLPDTPAIGIPKDSPSSSLTDQSQRATSSENHHLYQKHQQQHLHRASPKMNQSVAGNTRSRSHSGSRTGSGNSTPYSTPQHQPLTNKRLSGKYQNDSSSSPIHSRSNSNSTEVSDTSSDGHSTPNRYDSIRRLDPRELPVDEELKNAAWYQHGIPREIALEMLSQQEIGSFMVRESTTHPGCYALSVKVPKFDNPVGISHYLITRDPKQGGVRLKGVDKVWPTLTALVTHHTVMPEMLPCTLRLPRTSNNPLYRDRDEEDSEQINYYRLNNTGLVSTDTARSPQHQSDFAGMMHGMKI